jgi:hypothetical protein
VSPTLSTTEKDPDGWRASDKFMLVLETAGLNATVANTGKIKK